mmetsp:Transcript_119209/g.319937  ORF Transcript_119209/g.319937 Transcript_119209/m.319937 type:complete len:202 (+) Transcript_119209:478-1083(+)
MAPTPAAQPPPAAAMPAYALPLPAVELRQLRPPDGGGWHGRALQARVAPRSAQGTHGRPCAVGLSSQDALQDRRGERHPGRELVRERRVRLRDAARKLREAHRLGRRRHVPSLLSSDAGLQGDDGGLELRDAAQGGSQPPASRLLRSRTPRPPRRPERTPSCAPWLLHRLAGGHAADRRHPRPEAPPARRARARARPRSST